ncbi:MAG: GTPase [Desulforegulaceae bacterium]|nr:GTPase [Desulforegulaceae bacterium]
MWPWIIGGAIAAATAIGAALSDSEDSYSTVTTSDEEERTKEALGKENEKKEENAWFQFKQTAQNEMNKLSDISEKYSIKSLSLRNIKNARKNSLNSDENHINFFNSQKKAGKIPKIIFEVKQYKNPDLEEDLEMLNFFSSLIAENISSIVWDTASCINSREIETDLKLFLLDKLGENVVNDLEKFLKEANKTKPKIAATGLLKAGKSTVMNCLTGDFSNQRFKTGIVRETIKEKIFEKDGYLFVDTPGFDANDKDTNEAVQSLKVADVVLFVHNMNGGSLDYPEKNFLEQIKNNWEKPSDFIEKIIVVLSHLDKKEKDQIIIEKDIRNQFISIFGIQPQIISISSSRYLKGVNENKNLLTEKSNYAKLHKTLGEMTLDIVKNKKQRYLKKAQNETESILIKLRKLQKDLSIQVEKKNMEHYILHDKFSELVGKANNTIEKAYSNYLRTIL